MVQILLDAGVNPGLALNEAINHYRNDIVRRLLDSGWKHHVTEIMERDVEVAYLCGHLDTLKLLFDAGADRETSYDEGMYEAKEESIMPRWCLLACYQVQLLTLGGARSIGCFYASPD